MAPQKGHPQVSQGGKAGGFSSWSHILKTVSVTHKELAGEEAGEGPSESAEAQNSAEKCVRGFHSNTHPTRGQGLFMAVSEKAGATAKNGLAGVVVLEREKHGKRK